jgi:hypothetical protein
VSFGDELRECLALVLGEEPPDGGSDDPLLAARQWLAGRNLGLVPIADAASFAWAGHWVARVDGHAVVMFGSPSGPLHDPGGAFAAGGEIEQGWVVAPLELGRRGYGGAAGTGTVEAILVAPAAELPLVLVEEATALAGRGLEGDRYAAGAGTFGGRGGGYELTLVAAEALAAAEVGWEEARRNLVTRGVDLDALIGRRFRVGAAECVGRRRDEPCAHLERLTRPGVLRALVHRGGLRADILAGGPIRVGDAIEALD